MAVLSRYWRHLPDADRAGEVGHRAATCPDRDRLSARVQAAVPPTELCETVGDWRQGGGRVDRAHCARRTVRQPERSQLESGRLLRDCEHRLSAAPRVVVSLEAADLTEPELRQEIRKLRRRVEKLAALLRLALGLLRATVIRLLDGRRAYVHAVIDTSRDGFWRARGRDVRTRYQRHRAARGHSGHHPFCECPRSRRGRGRGKRQRAGRRLDRPRRPPASIGLHRADVFHLDDRSVVALAQTSVARLRRSTRVWVKRTRPGTYPPLLRLGLTGC